MSFTKTSCISGILFLFLALAYEATVPRNANAGFIAVNDAQRYKVSEVLKDAFVAGISVCRTWAFSDAHYQKFGLSQR